MFPDHYSPNSQRSSARLLAVQPQVVRLDPTHHHLGLMAYEMGGMAMAIKNPRVFPMA
jgi:hypothetical protein